jgi:DNA-binding response OmpR family regulator
MSMKGTILVAEDDRNLRRILCAMLTREGYEVSEAVDGARPPRSSRGARSTRW